MSPRAHPGGGAVTKAGLRTKATKESRARAGRHRGLAALAGALSASEVDGDQEDVDDLDEERSLEDELFDDAPEEADAFDTDLPDDHPLPSGRTPRPSIYFVESARPAPDLGTARLVNRRHRGGTSARIQLPDAGYELTRGVTDDELEQSDLTAIAAALLSLQPQSIIAPDRLTAFDSLTPMLQKDLASETGVDETVLSRNGNMLIGCHWGLCRLQFFWWRGRNPELSLGLRKLVEVIREHPGLTPNAHGATAARRLLPPGCDEEAVAKLGDRLRKQVPVVREVLTRASAAEALWSSFPDVSDEQGARILGLKGDRGTELVHLVLAGAFR